MNLEPGTLNTEREAERAMTSLRERVATVASEIEARFDLSRVRFRVRRGLLAPIRVVTFRGYGTPGALHLRGRVVSRKAIGRPTHGDSAWRNLRFCCNHV